MIKEYKISYQVTFFNGLGSQGHMEYSTSNTTKEQVEMRAMAIVMNQFFQKTLDIGLKTVVITVTEIK